MASPIRTGIFLVLVYIIICFLVCSCTHTCGCVCFFLHAVWSDSWIDAKMFTCQKWLFTSYWYLIFLMLFNTICCFLYKLHDVMQVLATICEELPPDCVVLVYLSASGLHLLCLFKYSLSLMSCYTRLREFILYQFNHLI